MALFSSGIFYLVLCVTVGYYANTINRSGIGWSLASFIITPFFASMVLLIIGNPNEPNKPKENE